jgi:hypothetical protein
VSIPRVRLAAGLVLAWALPAPGQPAPGYGLPLQGEEAESFLRTARVVARREIGRGITHSDKLTLSDGTRTLAAAFKTIDERKRGVVQFQAGGFEVDFVDSWMHEVAAYELDKLLGLGMVPPTVERVIGRVRGAVQLWVEGVQTEGERRKKGLGPPDNEAWSRQIHKVRLFHQLTYNTDRANVGNVLVDPDFRVYVIDASRAFRIHTQLVAPSELVRFSRGLLDRLRALDETSLQSRVGRWLTGLQIRGLLARRDHILAQAGKLAAEKGESAVLYP